MDEKNRPDLNQRTFADVLDCIVDIAVVDFVDDKELSQTAFTTLISMGELVDRLSIVNIKLFNLKNDVMRNQAVSPGDPRVDDSWFKDAAIYDVRLCEERSRIKSCIDKKLLLMIKGGSDLNEEFKSYG